MFLVDKILKIYPDLVREDFYLGTGTILLRNDGDEKGDYIAEWKHPTHAQPTQEQLDAVQ